MADDSHDDEDWGNSIAKVTFICTVVSAALFAATVFVFIR